MHKYKSKSKYSRKNKNLPKGNWINTAWNYYVKNNILYAKLKTQSGFYIDAQTHFMNNDIFENKNGVFVLVGTSPNIQSRRRHTKKYTRKHRQSSSHKSIE